MFKESPVELVMTQGMIIEAINKAGGIRIEASQGMQRIYTWNDHVKTIRMLPRKNRWLGSLGVYHPGGGKDVNLVAQEGQQHFCSEQEAAEWLRWQKHRFDWVYTSDGLVIGWYESGRPKKEPGEYFSANMEIWQIYINGKKPSNLKGAANNQIRIYIPDTIEEPKSRLEGFVRPSGPKTINGRLYSGKSLDLMKEQDLSPQDVEEALEKGDIDKEGGVGLQSDWVYYWWHRKFSGSIIVVLDAHGRVVRATR